MAASPPACEFIFVFYQHTFDNFCSQPVPANQTDNLPTFTVNVENVRLPLPFFSLSETNT